MEKTMHIEAFACNTISLVGLALLILIILNWLIILHFHSNLRYALLHFFFTFRCDNLQVNAEDESKIIQTCCTDKKLGDHNSTSPQLIPIRASVNDLDHETVVDEKKLSIRELRQITEKLGGTLCDAHGGEVVEGSKEIAALFEEEPSLEEVKEAFYVFDQNKDGFIDAGEINKVLCALGFAEASEVECKRMIKAFDDNADGRIDFQEFVQLMDKSFC